MNFTVFDTETNEVTVQAFKELYEFSESYGKLTDIQKKVLQLASEGLSYEQIRDEMDFSYIGSVQAGLKGGIKNILGALNDLTWLFNNDGVIDFIQDFKRRE